MALGVRRPRDAEHRVDGVVVLEVERELEVGAAGVVELRQRGDVARELGPRHLADRSPHAEPAPHDAVVVEHGLAVLR